MPAVQQHGLDMERILGSAYLGRALPAAGYTDPFDIPAHLAADGRPVSIKTAKRNGAGGTLCLGDARRIWATLREREITLICGIYTQLGGIKSFTHVHEITLTPDLAPHLLGRLTDADIANFHAGLLDHPVGSHAAARRWARDTKRALADRTGRITLNPKIDSGRQRRLQCSVRMNALLPVPNIVVRTHTQEYCGQALPIRIASGARQFNE